VQLLSSISQNLNASVNIKHAVTVFHLKNRLL